MKKILALLLAAVMLLALAACGTTNDTTTEPPAGTDAPATEPAESPADEGGNADGEVLKVGVCQLAVQPALDAATEGFVDALDTALGY